MSRPASIFGEEHLALTSRISNSPFILLIWAYRFTLSPVIGRQCRFDPTCSRYALDAFRRYGTLRGIWMTVTRIGRCHPFNKGGYDPVPALAARRDIDSEHSLDCDPNEEGKRGHA